ncbi:MAG TPA: hypothetical protein VMJ11_28175 [Paraburkholderia sp.]|uniref:hypothetical protein n=1 Tax=Paraburkholderia sp. TaxID=1926495 RepID=UPI002C8D8B31|nr:hypothetical protein [Paraburkholderia sp.]HTR10470.1 hypothetical protein [Paraburkholderia sp.]
MATNPSGTMQPLTGLRLIEACEAARREPALLRPLALLAAALPECDRNTLLEQTLGERNRALLALRALSFGPELEGYAECGACGAPMTFRLAVEDALVALDACAASATSEWVENGTAWRLRQATTADLLAAARMPDDALAERELLRRCLGASVMYGANASAGAEADTNASTNANANANVAILPQTPPSALAEFERLHAGAELHCALRCPQCGHAADHELDLADFVWREARHAARRLLTDIHTLASHYGWSEAAIAAMSQARRDAYLELLDA